MAVCFLFRFSSPLTVALRRLTPVTYSSWVPSSKRMFLRSALPQKPFSGPETSRHPESSAQTRQNHEAHSSCQRGRQDKSVNMEYDQGLSRLPFLDATLTAIMGIGIGEPQLRTGRFVLFPSFTVGYPSRMCLCPTCDVGSTLGQQAETRCYCVARATGCRVGGRFLSPGSEIRLMLGTHPDLSKLLWEAWCIMHGIRRMF
jgi:hypothetical protein